MITDGVYKWIISRANIDEIEDEIADLETALDGKANLERTHSIDEITKTH